MRASIGLVLFLWVGGMFVWSMPFDPNSHASISQNTTLNWSPSQMTNNVIACAWNAVATSKWMRHYYYGRVFVELQRQCSNSVWRVTFARGKDYKVFGGGVSVYIDAKSFEVLGMYGTK